MKNQLQDALARDGIRLRTRAQHARNAQMMQEQRDEEKGEEDEEEGEEEGREQDDHEV